jgi:type I restriction enzyme, S subunit
MLSTINNNGWQLHSIEDVCLRVTSGGTPSRGNPAFYQNGTIEWVKTGELKDWFVDEVSERITEEAIRHSSAKVLPTNTVLIAMYGDGRTMGSVGMLRHPAATNQACCAMIVDEKKCLPKFLLYSLIHHRRSLISLALGGAQRNLSGKTIRAFKINIPPLESQRKIGALLSYYDDLIQNNTRRIQILEEMARRIYEEWFVHFRFPGHENVSMVESELGLIPDGWDIVRLEDQYKTGSGGTPSRKNPNFYGGNINWVKTQELNDGFIFESVEKITSDGLNNSSAKIFPAESVLVAMYGATIGALGILANPSATNQACCAIMKKREPFGFEYAFLSLLENRSKLIELRAGAAQQNINQVVIKSFKMLKPDDGTVSAFNHLVSPILNQISSLQKRADVLRRTRDLLLPKLISGEIDVSNFLEL